MRLNDIKRNNLTQAEAYYLERGEVSGEVMRILYMLQDDPEELEKLSRGWKMATPDPLDF